MKLSRRWILMLFMLGVMIAHAGGQGTAGAERVGPLPVAPELQRLAGTWKGVMVGQEKDGEITISITGDSLHFHRDTNFWFKTTFTLPAGTSPRQLKATIRACAPGQESSVGQVVVALYRIEEQTLTLVAMGDAEDVVPESLEAADGKGSARYKLRKVQPPGNKTGPAKAG